MPKRTKQSKTKLESNNLQDYLDSRDGLSLLGLISSFENSDAWRIFLSYSAMVQRQYEVEALDLMGKEGSVKSAAFASGYAKACEDITTGFMEGLKNTVKRVNPVVENPRPEEVEIEA